ncbi:hypothetical protein XELAEV_18033206mg [Xenopus laevis]|uniref:Uncharacterized protein n=1 Tax=Xenopus laevis TaxID=8355 RepID=A0A974CJH9_XENLA|nr:hypothetical protein XELAEV_18033206mg [Xenopus laevis]
MLQTHHPTLSMDSFHLDHTKKTIIYSQALRYKQICSERAKTSKPLGLNNGETHPCGRKRCKTCPHILSDKLPIAGTLEEYNIHRNYACSPSNAVYIIICTKCPTRSIYDRENGQSLRKMTTHHRFTINNKRQDTPAGKHFNRPNHSLFNFNIAVVKGNFKTEKVRKVWEYE